MENSVRVPAYRIFVAGVEITDKVQPRLCSLELTQARGRTADQLDIELNDADGGLMLPTTGALVELQLGFAGQEMVNKGSFTVDEIEHSGPPDRVRLRARSADLMGPLRERREQSWHATTLGTIVQTIAGRNGLAARVDPVIAAVAVAHVDQTSSDIAFVTRLAHEHDAVATVKGGRLVVLPINATRTPTGRSMPALEVTRASGDGHRYHQANRDAYSGVRAYWHDPASARQRSVLVGLSGNAKRLREGHASEADALAAATAEWQRIQRGAATLGLTLAIGVPQADAQSPLTVAGFKPQIDSRDWLITTITHRIDESGGLTARIEAELTGSPPSDVSEDPGE